MSKIIKGSDWETIIQRRIFFKFVEDPGSGFVFELDNNNKLLNSNPAAIENYESCLTGMVKGKAVVNCGVEDYEREIRHNAVIECDCGNHIELDGDVSCETCGQWYNSSGQKLVDPCYWGEETGESFDSSGRYIGGGYE